MRGALAGLSGTMGVPEASRDCFFLDEMPHWLERGANPCDHAAYPQIPTCAGCSACPGDTSVCMGNVGLLGADWQDKAPGETGPSAKGKKNLYTSPGRKGGAGTSLVERTIGRNPPVHMKDEYQRGRLLGKQLRKQARERIAKPFNSAPSCGSGLFSGRDMFLSSTPGPAHDQAKAERKPAKAFLPANPGKSGAAYCTLSKVGRDYVPLPDDAKVRPLLISSTYLFSSCVAGTCQGGCVESPRDQQICALRLDEVRTRAGVTCRHAAHRKTSQRQSRSSRAEA